VANFTQCSFAVPITITTATQIKITFDDSAVGATTRTATAVAGTYYQTVDTTISSSSTGLLNHLLYQLQQEEAQVPATSGTYSIKETTTTAYRGRMYFYREQGHADDDVAQIEILGGEITWATLGCTVDPAVPDLGTGTPATFEVLNRGLGHWILPAVGLLAGTQETPQTMTSAVSSPDGTTIRDVWGTVTRKSINMLTIPGAATFTHYSADTDYCAVIGCNTGDLAAAFDDLRSRWAEIADTASVRFTPDIEDTTTHLQLVAGAQDLWIGDLLQAAVVASDGPLYFDLIIDAFKVV